MSGQVTNMARTIVGLRQRVAELEVALEIACDLLVGEGYDTDPDYKQEWATVSGPLARGKA